MDDTLKAGAATVDITPSQAMFLFGYPHVPRRSTGTHDPLLVSALYLASGPSEVIFVANDVVFLSNATVHACRERISRHTGVPRQHIMITATHTHSGPVTADTLFSQADPVVPKVDAAYLCRLEDGIAAAAIRAHQNARDAEAGLVIADATGIGTNRRDPAGPANLRVPVLFVRSQADKHFLACMLVCCMHPTVLHEGSTLFSGDFPGMARQYLQSQLLGADCPVLHHTGPCGNQSPRHVVCGQTFAEAVRLGEVLGRAIVDVFGAIRWRSDLSITCMASSVELPPRRFPTVEQAEEKMHRAIERLATLRRIQAPRAEQRTAECDWFGAEEAVTLAKAQVSGRLDEARQLVMPAAVQAIGVGPWRFVGWPGEAFVEFGLEVQSCYPDAFVVTLANGELQGYLVTQEAVEEGGYEASNAIFQSPDSGQRLVEATMSLLNGM